MPYSPQVQDRSGDYLAQGIGQLGQGIADGFKSYQQNKQMSALALGKFEGALKANPDLLQFLNPEQPSANAPGDVVKAYTKLQKDGSIGLKDAALLSTFADSYQSAKDNKQKQEMQAAQTQQQQFMLQQAQQDKAREDAMNAQLQQYAQVGQQLNRGEGQGVIAPQMSKDAMAFMKSPLADVVQSGGRVTNQQLADYALKMKPTLDSRAEVADIRAQSAKDALNVRAELSAAQQAMRESKAEADALKSGKKDTAQAFEETKKLRDEFGAKDSARNFGIVSTSYELAKKLAAQETPAGDMAFVYSLMKAYDPRSTVREGERADASNTGSVPDRIFQAYNKAMTGEVLSPKMRTEFLKTLDDAANSHHSNMMRDAKQYEAIAKKRGLDPEEVIPPDYMNWGKATAPTTTAPVKILSIKKVN